MASGHPRRPPHRLRVGARRRERAVGDGDRRRRTAAHRMGHRQSSSRACRPTTNGSISRRQAVVISASTSMAASRCRSSVRLRRRRRQTSSEGFHEPVSSPDGRMFAGHYNSREPRGERIAVVPLDGSPPRLFPNVTIPAEWSVTARALVRRRTRRRDECLAAADCRRGRDPDAVLRQTDLQIQRVARPETRGDRARQHRLGCCPRVRARVRDSRIEGTSGCDSKPSLVKVLTRRARRRRSP